MTNNSELSQAEDKAIEWAILLADDPDDINQQKRFHAWLHADPLHVEIWARTLHVYEGLGKLPPSVQKQWPDERSAWLVKNLPKRTLQRHGNSLSKVLGRKQAKPVCLLPHWKRSVAGLVIAASFLLILIPRLTLTFSADYLTGTGEQKNYVLEDGSKLYLAPKSAVDVAYTESKRLVRLIEGSAFFEVRADTDRPFHVDAGGTRTTVLGTSFDVTRSESGVIVSVAHGQVRVEDGNISPMMVRNLTAGDRLLMTGVLGASLSRMMPEDVARWRKGELVVRDLPVREVVKTFRDYYGGTILVTEPFASQRVTGLYRLNNPVSTLTEMALAHDATAKQITPWLLVLSQ